MNNEKRIALITALLTDTFNPIYLQVVDESHHHAGHPGAKDGRGHFSIEITATAFADKNSLTNHRLIYAALDDLMKTDSHALTIKIIG